MEDHSNNYLFCVGDRFDTFEALSSKLDKYCKSAFVHYWTRDSRKIACARVTRYINENLIYYRLKYTCVLGGQQFHPKGTGQRYSFSIRATNCPAHITIRASKEGTHLEVISVDNCHNHEQTEEIFRALPKERKIPDHIKEDILDLMKLNVEKAKVKEYVNLQIQKELTTKDLTNIISGGRLERRPSLTKERSYELLSKLFNMDGNDFENDHLVLLHNSQEEIGPCNEKRKRLKLGSFEISEDSTYEIIVPDSSVIVDGVTTSPIRNEMEDSFTENLDPSSEGSSISVGETIEIVCTELLEATNEEIDSYCNTCGQQLPPNHMLHHSESVPVQH